MKKAFKNTKIFLSDPINLFTACMLLSMSVFFVVYTILGNGRFVDMFFVRAGDTFMDFFNSIRDAAQLEGVYTERHVIYPPLANLIFLILSRFTPNRYNNTSFDDRQTFTDYTSPLMLVFIFFMVAALIVFYIILRSVKRSENTKFLFALTAIVSVPMLYMMERGNIIILCLAALAVYAFTYNSDSKIKREIGLIALAFTFAIKLYPVIFGWFLIVDKRFKEALRCFIYGILMLVLPSFFFGGPACFLQVFKNIFSFSSGSGGGVVSGIASFLGISSSLISLLAYAWCFVLALAFASSSVIHKNTRWKSYLLGCLLILAVPSLTSLYSWAFIIIPFIMFCNSKKQVEKNASFHLYFWFMFIPFLYIPGRITFFISTNIVAVYVFTAALSVYIAIDTLMDTIGFIKDCKKDGVRLWTAIKSS